MYCFTTICCSSSLELLDELVRSYLDRETTVAWDPRFKLHTPSTVGSNTVYGLTVSETDPRYELTISRLVYTVVNGACG